MGLDVYLRKFKDYNKTQALEAEYEKASEANWDKMGEGLKYESIPETQKKRIREANKAVALGLGLDEYGSDKTGVQKIEIDSSKYPDHMFKIGYFRSSYNSGGIDCVLGDTIGKSLGWIFPEHNSPDYSFVVNWASAKERAEAVLVEYRSFLDRNGGVRVEAVSHNPFTGAETKAMDSTKKAMDAYLSETTRVGAMDSYSNRKGAFYMKEPMRVKAVIPGYQYGSPCSYLIYEAAGENEWYIQALEIVLETIEYVLAQPDQELYRLSWSS